MPFTSPADAPANVKAFWKKVGASAIAKRQWINVFNSCFKRLKDEGRCIASANSVLKKRLGIDEEGERAEFTIDMSLSPDAIADGEVDGQPAWVIPVIFTREGIQNHSFKPWDELLRAEWSLDGAPVTLGHPPGHGPSLLHPDIIIGEVLTHSTNEEDRSLVGSIGIWKNDPRSAWLVDELALGLHRDGSVGFTTTLDMQGGDFNGEEFINIERDMFFDHFAVGIVRGACPAPACGLLYNMQEIPVQDLRENREFSITALQSKMWGALNPDEDDKKRFYVTELFDSFAIVRDQKENTFKVPYTVNEQDKVVLGKKIPVRATYTEIKPGSDVDNQDNPQGQCPEGQHHHPFTDECVDDEVMERETTARDILDAMNIFTDEEHLSAASIIFVENLVDCVPCQDSGNKHDDHTFGDQSYTFKPPWSDVDKSALPSSAFMIVRDAEKKSTWKLPFKNPGGAINCNAIRAILSVLGGARGGVDLTIDERNKARRAAARHQRRCLAARQNDEAAKTLLESDALKEVLYTAEDINVSGNNMSDENDGNDGGAGEGNDGNGGGAKVITDAELRLKVDELELELKTVKTELKEFKEDSEQREEAEVKALRSDVHSLVEDPEVYSYNQIQAMTKEELLVAKRLLDSNAPADRGASVSTGLKSLGGDIEYIRGQPFSVPTVGEKYVRPKLNPVEPPKEN